MNLKNFFSLIFCLALAWFVFYISWILWVLILVLDFLIYLIIAFLIYFLVKKFFKKDILSFKEFSYKFIYSFSVALSILFILIWSFSYYVNEKVSINMQEFTVSNWEKTLVFQWMIHIASPDFYEEIKKNLQKYKSEWFVHFFEWVRPGSAENTEAFNKALWVKFDEKLYENMSKLYWVEAQDYEKIIWEISEKDINIDVSLDYIMEEYNKLTTKENKNQEAIDISKEIDLLVNELNSKQLAVLVYVNKAVLKTMLSNQELLKDFSGMNDKKIFEIILWKRNEILATEIQNSEYKKIYATYGLLHFEWVLKLLQEKDPNWKIISVKEVKAL